LSLPAVGADPVARLLADFAARQPIRAGSFIVTVFGDAVLPRGGQVMLADLIGLLEASGLNDSQVRTALSRLVADGWLKAQRLGRSSVYRLTEIGRHRFAEATRRIYFGPPREWAGNWHVVLLPPGTPRDELAKDLGWLGFGTLAPGVMLHPTADAASLASVIGDLPPAARPLVIAGTAVRPTPSGALPALVARCWDLDALARSYGHFLTAFAALRAALQRGFTAAPLPALLARLMLIHDYRRIILRDPMLPPKLLPRDWAGREAYAAARDMYRALARPAEHWIDEHLHDDKGALPPPHAAFRRRFP
jgi:phenylacetic acid degradation operon negative regulatory protein